MKQFRKIIFLCHLVAGVSAGILIFIMSVTGALLSFESNILEFAEREMRFITPPSENSQRLLIREIVAKVSEAKPEAKLSAITLQNKADAAATVVLGGDGQVFVNPTTVRLRAKAQKAGADFSAPSKTRIAGWRFPAINVQSAKPLTTPVIYCFCFSPFRAFISGFRAVCLGSILSRTCGFAEVCREKREILTGIMLLVFGHHWCCLF